MNGFTTPGTVGAPGVLANGFPVPLANFLFHDVEKAPRVSVVVAAKDEENNIERCVVSLLAQDYPGFQIIVVDDRSEDRTPAILGRLERTSGGQLRVITVKALREG